MRRWHLIALGIGLGLVLYGICGNPFARAQTAGDITGFPFNFGASGQTIGFQATNGAVYMAKNPGTGFIINGGIYVACAKTSGTGPVNALCMTHFQVVDTVTVP